jgi:aldehyde:ferredoxin oxidoreductase
MLNGYMGKFLHVELDTGLIKKEGLSTTIARDFIGGYGVMSCLLYDLIPPHVDPRPQNILAVATGLITASVIPIGESLVDLL